MLQVQPEHLLPDLMEWNLLPSAESWQQIAQLNLLRGFFNWLPET